MVNGISFPIISLREKATNTFDNINFEELKMKNLQTETHVFTLNHGVFLLLE